MAEEMKVKLDLDNAQALRKAQQFRLAMGQTTSAGLGMATSLTRMFSVIAGAAGIGLLIRGIVRVRDEMRQIDVEMDTLFRKHASRQAQNADVLGEQVFSDLQGLMADPATGKVPSRAQVFKFASDAAGALPGGARTGASIAFEQFSSRGGKITPAGLKAIDTIRTVSQGANIAPAAASRFLATIEGILSKEDPRMRTPEGQFNALVTAGAASGGTPFTAAEMATGAEEIFPLLMATGQSFEESLILLGGMGKGFGGRVSEAAKVIRRVALLAFDPDKRTPEMLAFAENAGIDMTYNGPDKVSRFISKALLYVSSGTTEERNAKTTEFMGAGAKRRAIGDVLRTAKSFPQGAADVRARIGTLTPQMVRDRSAEQDRSFGARRTRAGTKATAEFTQTPKPGTPLSGANIVGLLEGEKGKPDSGELAATTGFEAASTAFVNQRLLEEQDRLIGVPITEAQFQVLFKLHAIGSGLFRQLKAIRNRGFTGGTGDVLGLPPGDVLSALAQRHMDALQKAKDDANERHTQGLFAAAFTTVTLGTTEQFLSIYRLRLNEAAQFIEQVRRGEIVKFENDPDEDIQTQRGQIDTGAGGIRGRMKTLPPIGFDVPGAGPVDFPGIPTEPRGPIPGVQGSINMQINNFGGVPQGISPYNRGNGLLDNPIGTA